MSQSNEKSDKLLKKSQPSVKNLQTTGNKDTKM